MSLNFLFFCNFVFTRITALLAELYRFNPKPAPTLISGSERMDRIKYTVYRYGFDYLFAPLASAGQNLCKASSISWLLKQIDKLLIIRFFLKKLFAPSGTVHHMVPGIRIVYS